jgi:small-conductance mechanosensitive channel
MQSGNLNQVYYSNSPERKPAKRRFPIFHFLKGLATSLKFGLIFVFLFITAAGVFGQTDTFPVVKDTISLTEDTKNPTPQKPKPSFDTVQARLRKSLQKSVQRNMEEFENDKMLAKQAKFFADLSIEIENTREFLSRGIDTSGLEKEITNITKWYKIAADGVFINTGTAQTSRNLTITNIILNEALKRLDSRFEQTSYYLQELNKRKHRIDSLLTDSILLKIPDDSTSLMAFYERAVQAGGDLKITYRGLKNAINSIQNLNGKCQVVHNTLSIRLAEVEQYRKNLSKNMVNREFSNIWGSIGYARPIKEILKVSLLKNQVVMGFYLGNYLSVILVMGLLTLAFAWFLKYLDKTGAERMGEEWDSTAHKVLSHPWLISIFIMVNICQFFFKNPPFLFYASGWILSCIFLTVLFWNIISKRLHLPWILLLLLFMVTVLENSVLQASRPERWVMLFLSISILTAAFFSFKRLKSGDGNNRFLLIFVVIVMVMESISIIANIFGRYNLAKTALTSGIFNLVVAVLLLWTCHYLYEIIKIIALVFNLNPKDEKAEKVEVSIKGILNFPTYLNVLLLAGWFILFMRNFYAFTIFTEPFRDFMETERSLGAYTFSIQSIANFFIIMFTATVLSKVVTFFASEAQHSGGNAKKGLGSWLLLVRISIFSIAIFLAFAAAGIAMDKIAIIFSALSVGIGFGLQTLVNNLVSGLIIAFEKPVNVGDSVDINGQSGIMKSIGFRSSVVSTFDGSDVIIPNGDLLNAHLINWTLGDTKRRVEVLVGVAYGTDIEKVKGLLLNIVENDERILHFPGPTILVKEFAASSIDFRVLFWIDSAYNLWTGVKSDVLEQINIGFKKEGIEIPFAQQDINIRSIPQTGLPGKEDEQRGEFEVKPDTEHAEEKESTSASE